MSMGYIFLVVTTITVTIVVYNLITLQKQLDALGGTEFFKTDIKEENEK